MVSPVMGIGHGSAQVTGVDVTSTGDKWVYTPQRPINIIRWGVIADALIDVGAGMVVALDKRITAGTDTGRVNGAVSGGRDTAGGTITTAVDVAAGTGLYHDIVPAAETGLSSTGAGGSTAWGGLHVDPGEQVVLEVTNAADTAGSTSIWFIEFIELPFAGDRIGDMTSVAS